MSKFEVHIDAYVLPEDHKVWKCHPGKTYRFYQAVREAEAAFLDIRGLGLNKFKDDKWNDDEVLKVIAADRWERELKRVRHDGKPKGGPNVSKVDQRNLTFLKGILFEAKKGDLIVVPAQGWRKEIMIGEFLEEPGKLEIYEAADGEEFYSYLGRPIKWRAMQEKRYFDNELVKMLHTRTAFFAIPKSLNEGIYRLAYENFVIGDVFSATFSTTKQHFSTSDSAVIGTWFNALSAVRDAIDSGRKIDGLSYLDLGLLATDNPIDGELSININSPGEYILRSLGPFALAVMAIFPLMEANAQEILDNPVKITMKTVGDAGTECPLKIEQSMKSMMETLSVARLQHACQVGKRAAEEATLQTKARLK